MTTTTKQLFELRFTHYAPKDSKEGTAAWLIAESVEDVIKYTAEKHHTQWLDEDFGVDEEEDADEEYPPSINPSNDFWETHPEEVARAEAMHLTVVMKDWGDRGPGEVQGTPQDLLLWWRGDYREVAEAYYGDTLYSWTEPKPITDAEVTTLVTLGIAIDLTANTSGAST
jgi:hypothetical protein